MDVGAWLLLAFFGWLVWWVIGRYRRQGGAAGPSARTGRGSGAEALATSKKVLAALQKHDAQAEFFEWPADSGVVTRAVGTSFYGWALTDILGKLGPRAKSVQTQAVLVPYDFKRGEKAVAVVVQAKVVGHLAREDVDDYLTALERQGQGRDMPASCQAEVGGRMKGADAIYWVDLDLDPMAGDSNL